MFRTKFESFKRHRNFRILPQLDLPRFRFCSWKQSKSKTDALHYPFCDMVIPKMQSVVSVVYQGKPFSKFRGSLVIPFFGNVADRLTDIQNAIQTNNRYPRSSFLRGVNNIVEHVVNVLFAQENQAYLTTVCMIYRSKRTQEKIKIASRTDYAFGSFKCHVDRLYDLCLLTCRLNYLGGEKIRIWLKIVQCVDNIRYDTIKKSRHAREKEDPAKQHGCRLHNAGWSL